MKFQKILNRKLKGTIQIFVLLAVSALPSVLLAGAFPEQQGIDVLDQGEKIIDFHSDINLNSDATVEVVETIRVIALGQEIKRGIYRDFPTKYQDRYGNSHNVGFDIVSIMRDGVPEDYHTENMDNGVRVYFGNADVYLNPGVYTYEFTYKTDRQVGYFDSHDEFYWNVTGNGWVFPIDNASASVTFPQIVNKELLTASGYTGPEGSKAADLVTLSEESSATFMTTKPLNAYEGLTIVLEFPKGIIHEPTGWENFKYFLRDNLSVWISMLMLILISTYYYFAWRKVGRDPKSRSIIPQYESPRGFSPGEISYISKMGFENESMVAMIINMGVKKYLKVDELKVNYRLTKINSDDSILSEEEKELAEKLFEKSDIFEIKNANYAKVIECETMLKKSLQEAFKDSYFVGNWKYIKYGILISIIALLTIVAIQPLDRLPVIFFFVVWITIWSLFVYFVTKQTFSTWSGGSGRSMQLAFASILLIGGELIAIFFLAYLFSVAFVAFLMLLITINLFFINILKRRTLLGREIQDEIEGFKMFLSVTEKDRMNFHNPPEKTPELFEKFLPFALALGVENKWAEQFEDVFNKLGPDGYNPSWYHGNALSVGTLSGFTNKMSSGMSSTISSSSTPPGSSSGSGGGGSSGGGGGGGGGGGW